MTEQDFLSSKGYGQPTPDPIYRNDGVVYWYRTVPKTKKQQFVIRKWPPMQFGKAPSYELEMCYETRNGVWANTKFYGLTYTQLCANLDRLEGCLKQSLLYMDANPLHYRFDGED